MFFVRLQKEQSCLWYPELLWIVQVMQRREEVEKEVHLTPQNVLAWVDNLTEPDALSVSPGPHLSL